MAIDLYSIIPGQTFTLIISYMSGEDNIVSATMTIKNRSGVAPIIKEITTDDEDLIVLDEDSGITSLTFTLSEANTLLLLSSEPYYLYDIICTLASGAHKFVVNLGRLVPEQTIPATLEED